MIAVRKSNERGATDIGWLDSKHSFSFGEYYDPRHMGFRNLRVINEDKVAGGQGFGRHPHRDMEILSYVLEGSLGHKDSMGNGSVIKPGDVQRMSAGTGVAHSEMNPDPKNPVHFLQIWLLPEKQGMQPGYEQKAFSDEEKRGKLRLVASRDGRDGSVTIHSDVSLYASLLAPGDRVEHSLARNRNAWVQVLRGAIELNGKSLGTGDGAAISGEEALALTAKDHSEVLLFDLA
ncbi:MAG: pirin family protein [Polyangiales bacterium]